MQSGTSTTVHLLSSLLTLLRTKRAGAVWLWGCSLAAGGWLLAARALGGVRLETSVSWLIKPRRARLCSPSMLHIGAGFFPGDFSPSSDAPGGSGLGRMLLGRRALAVPGVDALF